MQSKKMSLIETVFSVIIGYIISIIAQLTIFPIYDINISFSDNLAIGLFFTVVSIIRGYYVRRLFNWIKIKKDKKWK